MQIADKYSPQEIESKWYDYWIEKRVVSLGTRSARTLHDRNSAPQRNGHAPHGSHAQQHAAGRAGAPRPHVGQERLLGAGHGPRVDRHRGQGRGDAARKGHRKIVALARKVPRIRLGMEGEVRRHDPQAAAQAGRLVRLGADLLHDGLGRAPESVIKVFCDLFEKAGFTAAYAWRNWNPRRKRRFRTKRWSSRSRTASSTTCATRSRAPTGRSSSPRRAPKPFWATRRCASTPTTRATPPCRSMRASSCRW